MGAARDNTDAIIWRLRGEYVDYRSISKRLAEDGVKLSHSAVFDRYKRMLSEEVPEQERDERRAEEERLIDSLSAEAFGILRDTVRVKQKVFGDDGQPVEVDGVPVEVWGEVFAHGPHERLRAIRELTNLSKRRAALFNLDAPRTVHVEGLQDGQFEDIFERARLDWELSQARTET